MPEFSNQTQKDMNIIDCPMVIGKENTEAFYNKTDGFLSLAIRWHFLDFSQTKEIHSSFYKSLIQFKNSLEKDSKKVFSICLNEKLKAQVVSDGMSSVFNAFDTKEKALYSIGIKKQSTPSSPIDVSFINPFLTGTIDAFKVQADVNIEPGKPYLKSADYKSNIGIAGVLSLMSETFNGSISLCFPSEVFLAIYNDMVDEDCKEINPEIQDAAGELLNIIFGTAKTKLNDEAGHSIQKAIPTILTGKEIEVHQTTKAPTIIIPFNTPHGEFHLEIEKSTK